MHILPQDKFILLSPEQPVELLDRLRDYLSKPPVFEFKMGSLSPEPTKPFYGKIQDQTFRVWRNIRYRNSFQPIVNGNFDFHPMGTQIILIMKMHPAVRIFCYIWLAFVLVSLMTLLPTYSSDLNDPEALFILAAPLGIFAFFLALVYGAFYFEARKTKPLLIDIFQAREAGSETGYGVV